MATAFAARDILGNVLSGFSMQFSKPFSLGDTIKVSLINHLFLVDPSSSVLMDETFFFKQSLWQSY